MGMQIFESGVQLVKEFEHCLCPFVSDLVCPQELRGRKRGPSKMGHQLSALQQKLNLTNG